MRGAVNPLQNQIHTIIVIFLILFSWTVMIQDLIERSVDVAFLQEIWENTGENSTHSIEIEKMLETHGLQYYSSPRPLTQKGSAYGGVALIGHLPALRLWTEIKPDCR